MKNVILTGTGMKCASAQIYAEYAKLLDFSVMDYDPGRLLTLDDSDKIIYGQYINAYSRLAIIWNKANGLLERSLKGFGGIAITRNGEIYCEYCEASPFEYEQNEDFSHTDKVVFKITTEGGLNIMANVVKGVSGNIERYCPTPNKPKTGEYCGAAALFACMVAMRFLQPNPKDEVGRILNDEINTATASYGATEEVYKFLLDLQTVLINGDNARFMLHNFPFEIVKQDFPSFAEKGKKAFDVKDCQFVYGDFTAFERVEKGDDFGYTYVSTKIYRLKENVGKFEIDPSRKRTEEEKRMLLEIRKSLDGNMILDKEIIELASNIKESQKMKFKFMDFILKGPTGTGKTTMCKQLGLLLNLPVVTFSCDPDTDQLALGCSIVPNATTENQTKMELKDFMSTIPSMDEMSFSPTEAYLKLTGEEKGDATPDDCMTAVMQKWAEISEKQHKGFRYVYSSIAKAMKYGWIVEIQEPTVIQRPGVLTALNALNDECAKLDLANGETIYRHPDAIMIYTTNLNLEGCYEMNQSVKSHCSQRTIELPDDKEILKRLMQSTGYTDEKTAKKMVTVYNKAKNYAASRSITDGAIDFRALQAWATANMIRDDVYENGLHEFIEKCTDDPDQKWHFIQECLNSQFNPKDVEKSGIKDLRKKI